jgi:hypothetical protein
MHQHSVDDSLIQGFYQVAPQLLAAYDGRIQNKIKFDGHSLLKPFDIPFSMTKISRP